jgi:nucleotide-binding universal stress UspA family protein
MVSTGHLKRRIVVGVNDSPSARAAVIWAARQARRRRCDLIITHIDPVSIDPAELHDAATSSHLLLAASATAASWSQPSVPVTSLLLGGAISDELIRLSTTALLLVIGIDEARPRGSYGVIGAIEDRVVMHSDCPVVTVSGRWDGKDRPVHRVVLGWTDDRAGPAALHAAAAEAQLRNASLSVVTINALPPAASAETQPAVPNRPAGLALAVNSTQTTHPGLHIDIDDPDPDADDLQWLIRCAEQADLVVIGCPHSDNRWSIRVGITAETLMRQAACPVMLVGADETYSPRKLTADTASGGPVGAGIGRGRSVGEA